MYLIKTPFNSYKPEHESDLEYSKKIRVGGRVKAKTSEARNPKLLKKYFALMKLVFHNQERYTDRDKLRRAITLRAGFYEENVTLDGEVIRTAKSISYEKMDDAEFSLLYEKSLEIILTYFFPYSDTNNIEEELIDFM